MSSLIAQAPLLQLSEDVRSRRLQRFVALGIDNEDLDALVAKEPRILLLDESTAERRWRHAEECGLNAKEVFMKAPIILGLREEQIDQSIAFFYRSRINAVVVINREPRLLMLSETHVNMVLALLATWEINGPAVINHVPEILTLDPKTIATRLDLARYAGTDLSNAVRASSVFSTPIQRAPNSESSSDLEPKSPRKTRSPATKVDARRRFVPAPWVMTAVDRPTAKEIDAYEDALAIRLLQGLADRAIEAEQALMPAAKERDIRMALLDSIGIHSRRVIRYVPAVLNMAEADLWDRIQAYQDNGISDLGRAVNVFPWLLQLKPHTIKAKIAFFSSQGISANALMSNCPQSFCLDQDRLEITMQLLEKAKVWDSLRMRINNGRDAGVLNQPLDAMMLAYGTNPIGFAQKPRRAVAEVSVGLRAKDSVARAALLTTLIRSDKAFNDRLGPLIPLYLSRIIAADIKAVEPAFEPAFTIAG